MPSPDFSRPAGNGSGEVSAGSVDIRVDGLLVGVERMHRIVDIEARGEESEAARSPRSLMKGWPSRIGSPRIESVAVP